MPRKRTRCLECGKLTSSRYQMCSRCKLEHREMLARRMTEMKDRPALPISLQPHPDDLEYDGTYKHNYVESKAGNEVTEDFVKEMNRKAEPECMD